MNTQMNTAKVNDAAASKSDLNNLHSSHPSAEFKNFITDIEHLISQTTSLTGADLTNAKEKLFSRIDQAKHSVEKFGNTVAQRARKGAEVTNTYVHEQPWVAIGVSAALGLVVGYAVSRSLTKKAV